MRENGLARRLKGGLAGLLLAAAATAAQTPHGGQTGDVRWVHDPSMIKQGATWYVFSTGSTGSVPGTHGRVQIPVRCSTDLKAWQLCGYVFDHVPDWIAKRANGVRDLWAPEIASVDGVYRLYYAYSIFGTNNSGIGLAVNKTLDRTSKDYAWVDKGLVIDSKPGDDFNAIDPNFVRDEDGADWLVFGSFWSGIKMIRLGADGMAAKPGEAMLSLARRVRPPGGPEARPGTVMPWQAEEAPFVLRHGEYYYLFTSWGACCQGVRSTYRTMVGRARSVKGPYVDATGKKLLEGGGTPVLEANAHWAGPGGESVWTGPDGQEVMVFHAYERPSGTPVLQVQTIEWQNGWPKVAMP